MIAFDTPNPRFLILAYYTTPSFTQRGDWLVSLKDTTCRPSKVINTLRTLGLSQGPSFSPQAPGAEGNALISSFLLGRVEA